MLMNCSSSTTYADTNICCDTISGIRAATHYLKRNTDAHSSCELEAFATVTGQGLNISTSESRLSADWLSMSPNIFAHSACKSGGAGMKKSLSRGSLIGFPAKEQLRWEGACRRWLPTSCLRFRSTHRAGDVRGPPGRRVCPLFAPRGSNQTRQRKEFIFEEEEGKEEEKMQSAEVE